MEKSKFWNDACRGGAIIGLIMAASNVTEQAMQLKGGVTLFGLMMLEWMALAVVFVWLLYRFTRKRAAQYSPEEGFSYGQGLGFVVILSLLSGLVVGVASYFYRHVVIGYDAYTEGYIDSIRGLLSQVPISPAMQEVYEQTFYQLENTPAPTIFGAIAGSVLTYVVVGGLVGLVVAGILSRAPRPFGDTEVK